MTGTGAGSCPWPDIVLFKVSSAANPNARFADPDSQYMSLHIFKQHDLYVRELAQFIIPVGALSAGGTVNLTPAILPGGWGPLWLAGALL